MKKIKVLIVDDSEVVHRTLRDLLSSDPEIEVIATATDPIFAMEKMKSEMPDVLTLDIEMPRMDGLTFLEKLMSTKPIPVVVCSTHTPKNSATALKALEYGAIEIIQKPKVGTRQFFEESRILLCDAIKAAARVTPKKFEKNFANRPGKTVANTSLPNILKSVFEVTGKVIVVGSSTGGTEALTHFLCGLSLDTPGVVVAQHMPEQMTSSFVEWLDGLCTISVKKAESGDIIRKGRALIAPGDRHIILKRTGVKYHVDVKDGPLVCRHRPSANVLFNSAARHAGNNAIGIVLTGMGEDGAVGLLEMKEAGAQTIAQDKSTSLIFDMPKAAIELGAVDKVLPLHAIAGETMRICLGSSQADRDD